MPAYFGLADGSVTPIKLRGSPALDPGDGIAWDGTAWVAAATGGGGGGAAEDVDFTPVGTIAATDVQAAVAEVATDAASALAAGLAGKAATVHTHAQADVTGLVADLAAKQPLDSDLTAIAALTTTSYGRALLELADAAAGRTAFGLGTAATQPSSAFDAAGAAAAAQAASQPLDSDLTAIAALTTTSFGRAFLALVDAAAARTAIGLGSVDNTSDANKPVSTATQTALDAKQPLDSDLTSIAGLSPANDDIVQRKSGAWTNRTVVQFKSDLALVKADVGLGNVDNTSDANKPVSTAQQTALDLKANLASPALTGSPTAPTQTARDGSTKLATTAYVDAADQAITANTQTGSYTGVLADAGKVVEMNSASATVYTIPPNSSVNYPIGTVKEVARIGTGTVTITPGAGVTIPNRLQPAGTASRTINAQYSSVSLRQRATDVWVLIGDLG